MRLTWSGHLRLFCVALIMCNGIVLLSKAQNVSTLQGLQQTAVENRRSITDIERRVERIERVADALQLESRLTRLESAAAEAKQDLVEIQSLVKAVLGGVVVMGAELIGRLLLQMFNTMGGKRGS